MTTTHDLDTVTGRNAALCDAADELGRLRAGQSVTVRRPGHSEARMIALDTFHSLASDPHGRPQAGGINFGYGPLWPDVTITVTPYEVAFGGWTVTPAGCRYCQHGATAHAADGTCARCGNCQAG
jgi:hypothetical protein